MMPLEYPNFKEEDFSKKPKFKDSFTDFSKKFLTRNKKLNIKNNDLYL